MRISDWSSDVCSSDLERRKLALNGHVSVAVAIAPGGRLIGTPEIRLQGVPVEEERAPFLVEATKAAAEAIADGGRDRAQLREKVPLAVRPVAPPRTRKCAVEGRRGALRVDPCGHRLAKKQNKKKT